MPAVSAWNWVEGQDNTKLLSEISIPGTHDSGARYEPIAGTAKCQNLTISDQLNNGIRFLDIRCRHIDNAFAIHHGSIYQHLNFDDVLNACFGFMGSHPGETIIMSVKEEYNSANISRSFEETFLAYYRKNPSGWYLGESVPALGDVRG
ncbi:MAG TPA: phosphatidylinositol-specific phospholipase C domain-containing protein [Spirochaetota bacterium]|nr:phosphatidylinositol-specific phospholipase C domain-containing protein [Spirochaetota bacterium]HPN14336.1 phosphatidylinositol-specific phospholipase C domain-containing protein [Spirochaetota bacterium]